MGSESYKKPAISSPAHVVWRLSVASAGLLIGSLLLAVGVFSAGVEAACTPGTGADACTSGTTRCFDERSIQSCNPESCVWDRIFPCRTTEICQSGGCIPDPAFEQFLKKKNGTAPTPAPPAAAATAAAVTKPKKPSATKPKKAAAAPACQAGARESRPCNPDGCPEGGNQSRTCRRNGTWGRWSTCRGCSGTACLDEGTLSVCNDQCVAVSTPCASEETCRNDRCAAVGASFMNKEILGDDGRLGHAPLLRRDGSPIAGPGDLAAAIETGDIVLYQGRQEIAVVGKPDSAWARFATTGGRRTPQGNFLSVAAKSCRDIAGSITDRYVQLEKVGEIDKAFGGRIFRVTYDYFDGCTDCWGSGPCFRIEAPEIFARGRPANGVTGWQWSLYDYKVVFGTATNGNEIGINPLTGEVSGLPDVRVSYYHGGNP